MAASMQEENNTSIDSKEELTGAEIMLGDDWTVDSDTSDPLEDNGQLSLFCRNCLSPYEGEEVHGGNFVLRCKNCDHRDVIPVENLNDTVYTTEPELLEGDLLNNRFTRILKAQEKLKQIDVQSPDYIDDQYRKYHYLHPKICEILNTSIKDMHAIVEEQRTAHNDKMIDKIVERRAKQTEEGLTVENDYVEVVGCSENGTFVICPDEFKVPNSVKIKCFRIGKIGVRNADKMILESGIPNDAIEDMPLFKARLEIYKNRMAKKAENNDTEEALSVSRKSRLRNKKIIGGNKQTDKKEGSNSDKSASVDENSNPIRSESEDSIREEMDSPRSNISKKKRKKKKARQQEKQNEILVKEEEKANEAKLRVTKLSTEDFLENIPSQKARPLTPEEINMFEEQTTLSEYVMQELDEISDLNDFQMDKVDDALKEFSSAFSKLREVALDERREETIKYVERTVAKMTEQVDVVRDEVITELRVAYRSKMVRTNKQRKHLEEAKTRVKEYGKLIRHYHETGQDEKLESLLEELNQENCEN